MRSRFPRSYAAGAIIKKLHFARELAKSQILNQVINLIFAARGDVFRLFATAAPSDDKTDSK